MKIILLGDCHILGKNPLCRRDNLVETQFNKLEEVINISNIEKAPIICVGDLTNSPDLSYSVFSKTAKVLSKANYPIFTIIGNHDLLYHNINSLNSTALGALLNSLPNLHLIDDFIKIYKIPIDYCHWGQEPKINNGKIFISHKPIIPKKMLDKWYDEDFFLFEKLVSKYKYKMCLCGHWHIRYSFNLNNHKLINTGALTRLKASEEAINTFPSITIINLDDYTYTFKQLQCAEKSSEIISLSSTLYLKKIKKNINIEEFLTKLKDNEMEENIKIKEYLIDFINNSEDFNINQIIEEILEEFSKETINLKEI